MRRLVSPSRLRDRLRDTCEARAIPFRDSYEKVAQKVTVTGYGAQYSDIHLTSTKLA
jgi:hypothetical protein